MRRPWKFSGCSLLSWARRSRNAIFESQGSQLTARAPYPAANPASDSGIDNAIGDIAISRGRRNKIRHHWRYR